MTIKRTTLIRSIGKMYLNNTGADLYNTNEEHSYCIVLTNFYTQGGMKRIKGKIREAFITKKDYEEKIEHEVNSIELDRAINYVK